ncbi:hypothetical protein ACJJTC_019611 [Scirpophaga incertulas]
MLRTAIRLTPAFSIPIFYETNENDRDLLTSQTTKPQTGWERVKLMYTKDEFNEVSPELRYTMQASLCGAFIGACFGGFIKSKSAYIYFMESNQATAFQSTRDAQKKLQDCVTLAFARGAYQWGWKLGFFSGTFNLIATTISVYKGDTSLVQYITAGAVTGGLFKANLGLGATLVGMGLGAALSTFGGLAVLGILKVTGASMDDIRKAMASINTARKDQFNQALEKSAKIKNDDITRHHDSIVAKLGEKKLDELVD